MNQNDEYDRYIEQLLELQFQASEIFSNNLTKGESREDFIKEQIEKQFSHLKTHKGFVSDNFGNHSNQVDLAVCNTNSREMRIGGQSCINVEDCLVVIEVKSNATSGDFLEANESAGIIKKMNSSSKPRFGLVCYRLSINLKTILKRFNYSYNNVVLGFSPNYFLNLQYPNIDFVLCLHPEDTKSGTQNKQFFLIKDELNGQYLLYQDKPVSKYFFKLLN